MNSMCVRPNTCTAMARLSEVYVLCIVHQYTPAHRPTVVCAEFVTLIAVLLFMPKGSHFASIHTAYKERQRNLTTLHYRFFSAGPFILATMS